MDKTKHGQVGIEILAVIGIIVILLIPFILGIYSQVNTFNDQVNIQQADQTAAQIAHAADVVAASGEGNNLSFQVTMPNNVEEIVLSGKEVVFKMKTASGTSEVVKRTTANLTGSMNGIRAPGKYTIAVWSQKQGDSILIQVEPI